MNYYGTESRGIAAHQLMKRIVDALIAMGCDAVIQRGQTRTSAERLIYKDTGAEVAFVESVDFHIHFCIHFDNKSIGFPIYFPPPVSMSQTIEIAKAVMEWIRLTVAKVPTPEHSVYEGRLRFYATFDQLHPLRDGYVMIYAYTEEAARAAAFNELGSKWSLSSTTPSSKEYPQGACGHPIIGD